VQRLVVDTRVALSVSPQSPVGFEQNDGTMHPATNNKRAEIQLVDCGVDGTFESPWEGT
jgi:hypothetical protein